MTANRLARTTARLALIASILTLAGCAKGPSAMPLAAKPASKVAAKGLSPVAAVGAIGAQVRELRLMFEAGAPALTEAPSDALVQRAFQEFYRRAKGNVMVDYQIDQDLAQAAADELTPFTSKDAALVAYLQGVADRLATRSKVAKFEVVLLDVPMVNAFNAGGHKVFVFKGLLDAVEDEAELAGILAHEMAHGFRRHVIRGIVADCVNELALEAVGKTHALTPADERTLTSFFVTHPPQYVTDFDTMLDFLQGKLSPGGHRHLAVLFNAQLATLALGREIEADADTRALRWVSAAGYDPHGLARTFDRMMTHAGADLRYYDHPALGERIAAARTQIREEKLHGDDRGADRLAAARVGQRQAPSAEREVAMPLGIAGAGCFARHATPAVKRLDPIGSLMTRFGAGLAR